MRVRITQIDGALPNLALMKLAAWHKARGDEVVQTRVLEPELFEDRYDAVYGSAIFAFSAERVKRFTNAWPDAIIGGTGTTSAATVEEITGDDFHALDYSGYPDFDASIGFTQRGCRLKCKFCVVPKKEGKNRSVTTIADIWRGEGHPKHLHLLDNDFFGQQEWRERIAEIRDGSFRVCLSQGINVRLIDDESAAALATIEYRNTKFNARQLYTAWDNLKDEGVFFKGVDTLERAGIPPKQLMAYMLIGYDPLETWDRIWHRFNLMVERGIKPYPMVYRKTRTDLVSFQRWVITGIYRYVPWDEYKGDYLPLDRAGKTGNTANRQAGFSRVGALAAIALGPLLFIVAVVVFASSFDCWSGHSDGGAEMKLPLIAKHIDIFDCAGHLRHAVLNPPRLNQRVEGDRGVPRMQIAARRIKFDFGCFSIFRPLSHALDVQELSRSLPVVLMQDHKASVFDGEPRHSHIGSQLLSGRFVSASSEPFGGAPETHRIQGQYEREQRYRVFNHPKEPAFQSVQEARYAAGLLLMLGVVFGAIAWRWLDDRRKWYHLLGLSALWLACLCGILILEGGRDWL